MRRLRVSPRHKQMLLIAAGVGVGVWLYRRGQRRAAEAAAIATKAKAVAAITAGATQSLVAPTAERLPAQDPLVVPYAGAVPGIPAAVLNLDPNAIQQIEPNKVAQAFSAFLP